VAFASEHIMFCCLRMARICFANSACRPSSSWALSLEVEGDDMRKLIANLTENAQLFAETR
jgi:hypothetical protein